MFATFQCTVNIVNEALRQRISRQLYERRKAEVGHAAAILDTEDSEDDEDLIGYDPIEPGLPPASSDQQRWWLDNGKMAKSTVAPPSSINGGSEYSSVVLNPNRPSNPFGLTEEPDWVAVPRATSNSRLSSFSSSISSSPYEHINHSTLLSTSTSSSVPRKLPPAFESTTSASRVGRTGLNDESVIAMGQKNDVPPPPPPRRQTNTSTAQSSTSSLTPTSLTIPHASGTSLAHTHPRTVSSSSQMSAKSSKTPPPVARKPAHLTSTLPSPSLSDFGKIELLDDQTPKPQLPRRKTNNISDLTTQLEANTSGLLTGGMQKRSAQPVSAMSGPSRVSTYSNVTIPSNGVSLPGMRMDERKPVLPIRPQEQQPQPPSIVQPRKPVPPATKKPVIDLLSADSSGEMNGWETLKPN